MSLLSPGLVINSKYTVRNLIKAGTYSETYKVSDDNGFDLFLKLYINRLTPDKLFSDGEVAEIRHCRSISHKNIIRFIDSGTLNLEAGECQWMVTNYFTGELLSEKIFREGKVAVEEAVSIFTGILEGLKYLHHMRLIHNDITPRNVMLASGTDMTPEIIDMGHVSKRVGGNPYFDTADLNPLYCANRTFIGIYEEETDIFSAIAVFYTMLFGHAPWNVDFRDGMMRAEKVAAVKAARKNALELSGVNLPDNIRFILEQGLSQDKDGGFDDIDRILSILAGKREEDPTSFSRSTPKTDDTAPAERNSPNQRESNPTQTDFTVKKGGGNGFKDIAGMNALKEMLYQKVIFVIKNQEIAQKYRLTPPNGMLLYGPPGCGKTFFAEKFAEETQFNFMLIKASDLASVYIHGSQEKIAELFKKAEALAPVVLCFDEFDALVPTRGSGSDSQHRDGEVNEFLSQLNNCSHRGIFVIATTNRPDKIDPAVLRTGRIDKHVYVPLPDREARKEMFILHLQGRPLGEIDYDKLADMTEGYIASDISYVVNDASMTAAFNERAITQEAIEETIRSVRPSIRPDIIAMYDRLKEQMEGIERSNSTSRRIGFK